MVQSDELPVLRNRAYRIALHNKLIGAYPGKLPKNMTASAANGLSKPSTWRGASRAS